MRLVTTTLLSILVLSAPVAQADQTGAKSSQPTPLPSWTGFYAGVNAGGLWNSSNTSMTADIIELARQYGRYGYRGRPWGGYGGYGGGWGYRRGWWGGY
jgi:hypothetical protein